MIVPDTITTLVELRDWTKANVMRSIELSPKSGLLSLDEFGAKKWNSFRGIPIKYQKKDKHE